MSADVPEPVIVFRGSEMVLLDSPSKISSVFGMAKRLVSRPGVALAYNATREAPQWIENAASIEAVGPAFDEIVQTWKTAAGALDDAPSDEARAALANVRRQTMHFAGRLKDLRLLASDGAESKWDDLPAGLSLSWQTLGHEGSVVYHAIRVSVWVASGNTALARLHPASWASGAPSPASRGGVSFFTDRLREALVGLEAAMAHGFWQLTIGGRNVELPRFTTVWPAELPRGVDAYLREESQIRLFCRRYLLGGDPLSEEVSGSVVEGNYLVLRRSRLVDGSSQELYVLAPFANGDEGQGEIDREHALITHQWEVLYLSMIGELLAGSTSGQDLDRVEAALLRMESAVGRLEAGVTRVQRFLASSEAKETRTRRGARKAAADRARAFDLAGVLLERMHRVRPRLIERANELEAVRADATAAMERTVGEFRRQLTTRPVVPFARGTIEATLAWDPVVRLRSRVELLARRGEQVRARIEALGDATHNILENERREEGRRSDERQEHLGEALALMALLTAVPLIIGSMDPNAVAASVAAVLPIHESTVLAVQPLLSVLSLAAALVIMGILLHRFFRGPAAPPSVGPSIAAWGEVLSGRDQPWEAARKRDDRAALLAEDERLARELAPWLDALGREETDTAQGIEALERAIVRQLASIDLPVVVADRLPLPRTAALLCFRGVDGNGIIPPGQLRRALRTLGATESAANECVERCRALRAASAAEYLSGAEAPIAAALAAR